MKNPIKCISATLAYIDPDDSILKVDCSVTACAIHFSQPAVNYKGVYTIKKTDSGSNAVTIYPYSGETIDGAASVTLSYENDYKTLQAVRGGFTVVDAYTERPALVNPTITGTGSAVLSKVNAVAATGVLSISDVCVDGETLTIGTKKYELCADAAQSLTEGSDYAVDIEAYTTKSTGTLTVATNPTAGQTLVIGPEGSTTTYTFRATADFDAAGEIELGATAAVTQANIIKAIMGTDGENEANAYVSIGAFADNAATVTALVGGTVGDSITTTDNITGGFVAGTLGSGADCTAANAVLAIVASVTANDTNVTAADGAGNTVDFTAKTAGAAGNAIATTETMANGAFTHATLVGGSDQAMTSPLFTNAVNEVVINTHSYASGTTAWTLSAAEQLKPVHKVTLAGGAVDAIIPLTPPIVYTFINGSGQALTVKGASGNGTEIANAKTAMVMSDGTNVIRITGDA